MKNGEIPEGYERNRQRRRNGKRDIASQGWASYDERVDIFSAGVTVFELFRPFATGMERVITLRELRDAGAPPPDFAAQHPQVLLSPWGLCSSHQAIRQFVDTTWEVVPSGLTFMSVS